MTLAHAQSTSPISDDIIAQNGLSHEEFATICSIMGREPNLVELGIFSVMWSEHCSYKTTRKWLSTLHTEGKQVVCGPGENAGIIDIGDNQAVVFKMESHNHPSFIEPYQGAATGVGGILRDVFTMGARPIALMNALRFGAPEHARTKHLVSGVVSGIGGYGNCVGVPTVGGECNFDQSYNGNILVNAMAVGLAEQDKIFYSAAAGLGNPVVYVGAKTGKDGIHGATMASAEFDDDSAENRPTVQVGDPFTEKLLIEACLELMQTDAIVAIQDMGAAGLTCSSLEMAGKGGLGIEMQLDTVPQREANMTPYEIMLSESQERMLMVIKPEREALAHEIFRKWELDVATVGTLTDTGRMVLKWHGEVVGDMPIAPISTASPVLDRPYEIKTQPATDVQAKRDISVADALKLLVACPDNASKRWIWEQYDSQVMNDTVLKSGSDAAIVRVHGTQKALAISTDCTPRYVYANPVEGGKQAVAECWRNITASGAVPLAITNCLNFGNPEKPEIMGQIVGSLKGITEACKALDFPVVSGNVSLYNETNGKGILPTPAIGGVGLLQDLATHMSSHFKAVGDAIFLIGNTTGHLGASLYLREVEGSTEGTAPQVDLSAELKHGTAVRHLIHSALLTACHDVSDGGLLLAIADMCFAHQLGADITLPNPTLATCFGEDQARYIISCDASKRDAVAQYLSKHNVPYQLLGAVVADALVLNGTKLGTVAELRTAYEGWLPNYMAA
jgi:phosphoribosylformylglycinamidine synthase subunit PurL